MSRFSEFLQSTFCTSEYSYEIFMKMQKHVHSFVWNGGFYDAIGELQNNWSSMSSCAKESYKHSNGFTKIVLASVGGYRMRIHSWDKQPVPQVHEPHDHAWDFCSTIIYGEMHNLIWSEEHTGNSEKFSHYRHISRGDDEKSKFIFMGDAEMSNIKTHVHRKSDFYTVHNELVHVARIPKNTQTATLIITGPRQKDCGNVFFPAGDAHAEEFHMPHLTQDQLTDLLSTIRKAITS